MRLSSLKSLGIACTADAVFLYSVFLYIGHRLLTVPLKMPEIDLGQSGIVPVDQDIFRVFMGSSSGVVKTAQLDSLPVAYYHLVMLDSIRADDTDFTSGINQF